MEDGGRCVASWRCADTRDGAVALWTYSWNGKAKTLMGISGRNLGSASHISRRTYAMKRESSKASCLGRAVRRRLVGGPCGETRRDSDRGRRERRSSCNGAHEGLRDRARGALHSVTPQLSSRNRGLTDGFHQLQHPCC
jgi:hypothetical protein